MALACQTRATQVAKQTRGVSARVSRARVVRAQARAGNWLPGSAAPEWLPDSLPGNFGFDPLGLAKDPASLARFTESEVIHGRWAMLGVAGALAVELLGFGNWFDAPLWVRGSGGVVTVAVLLAAVNGGNATWFGIDVPFDLNTLLAIDATKRIYPGGPFDPAGLSKGNLEELKLKEVKNGRLAMVAFLGFVAQHAATGKAPLAALSEHVSSPWGANFATNGVSLPF
ncbi:light-harvesting protein of photosystem I [Monoraphidium neglectum]|uniref:Chlorophyll a-b binding protein, chloroplastic n=1 Tax=Monoraphidium neglectum TaxID=145388 RepID=A0A0D2L4U6_9CHLO|nr:light-harvesting protein of photosystem I [Monoraphidium neglectum]KIZ02104.1 light-harvesting protein of photosystem I [Monoraphidium neglectum]|eukprot:XP_013901123.1 light-harvesting protein of photosystem I [Monoraphidium neglectum]